MDINYLGHSSFRVKGKGATLLLDPFDSTSVGINFAKQENVDIVTVSHNHPDHNFSISGGYVVNGPGEYEIKGVTIVGVATFHDDESGKKYGKNTVYRIILDGVTICHLGDLGHKLTTEQLEAVDGVDVLMVPVGGFYTIDAKTAAEVVAQISPKVVIPMHYKTAKHKEENFKDLQGVDVFLKEMGVESLAPVAKLSISKDRLPEQLQVVLLE